jgi:OTU domain-containing protein 3
MAKSGVHGTHLELVACAKVFKCQIFIHQEGQQVWKISTSPEGEDVAIEAHIIYYSWEHYDSVRNIEGPFSGMPQLQIQHKPIPSAVKEESMSDKMEQIVLQSVVFLHDDHLEFIRKLLKKHRQNPSAVVDEILEMGEDGLQALDLIIPKKDVRKQAIIQSREKRKSRKANGTQPTIPKDVEISTKLSALSI